jgi:hypothetical protein
MLGSGHHAGGREGGQKQELGRDGGGSK